LALTLAGLRPPLRWDGVGRVGWGGDGRDDQTRDGQVQDFRTSEHALLQTLGCHQAWASLRSFVAEKVRFGAGIGGNDRCRCVAARIWRIASMESQSGSREEGAVNDSVSPSLNLFTENGGGRLRDGRRSRRHLPRLQDAPGPTFVPSLRQA